MFLVPPNATPQEVDQRRQARFLYWLGWGIAEIAAFVGRPAPTISSWKSRDGWDASKPIERVESCIEAKLMQLVLKEPKSGADVRDIDLLTRQIERLARVRRYEQPGGHGGDLNEALGERNRAEAKKRPVKNHFDEEQTAQLQAAFEASLYGHQGLWFANSSMRTRVILKSRQIGATWYFAREALLKAVKTGRNQIFLSASKNQAHIFRQYMVAFAKEACGVDLTGDPITLSNGANIYFLGTSARTAQGYHGDFYFDEFFWTHRFEELNKVASAMATHAHWTKTYFSTPSSIQHQAYKFWTGDDRNRNRAKKDRVDTDVSHDHLAGGALAGGRWRHIVTVEDAEAAGCDLFDIAELRDETSPAEFDNLYLCQFVDDAQSVFPFSMVQPCMVDSWEEWDDLSPHLERPFGKKAVWLGYDPSFSGDAAALIVAAAPAHPGEPFRLLEKFRWTGMDFAAQAEEIKRLMRRYHVTEIGIDATGLGVGVWQLVRQFFPTAKAIQYSPEVKQALVLKALDTMRRKRLKFDAGWTDLAASFMAIRRSLTPSQRSLTYESGRNDETGHADLAWAAMHAMSFEPLHAPMGGGAGSIMEIY